MTDQKAGKYEDCIIAYLDILGFTQFVTESQNDSGKLENLIRAMDVIKAIPSGGKKASNMDGSLRTLEIRSRFFSDLLVFFLKKEPRDIAQLFFLMRYIQDRLWEGGYCLRGSIVFGQMYWTGGDDNVTVGPGLIDAYNKESQIAIYPRIMISTELQRFIVEKGVGANPFGAESDLLKDYIRQDLDGIYFLDLLNPGITRHRGEKLEIYENNNYSVVYYLEEPSDYPSIVQAVSRIIQKNEHAEDDKIRQKYQWLKNYKDSQHGNT